MWYEELKKCMERMQEEFLKTKDPEIQKRLQSLHELTLCDEEFLFYLKQGLDNLTLVCLKVDVEEEMRNQIAIDVFDDLLQYVRSQNQPLYFRVDLVTSHTKVYRKITIPACFSLADLAYLIILAFGGDGNHLFQFNINGQRLTDTLDVYNEEERSFAAELTLSDLDMEHIKKMEMVYDFGDDWCFKIRPLKRGQDNLEEYPFGRVFEGSGPDIWEDNHHLYEMYLEDPKTNLKDWIGVDVSLEDYASEYDQMQEFDLEECNDIHLSSFDFVKDYHETDMDYPESEDYDA